MPCPSPMINTAEAAAFWKAGFYVSLADLNVGPAPEGFKPSLASASDSYAFSVKDAIDPCHFAYFSDQDGVIFSATPVR